jgi:GH15 family glucan-1,4-alpha-glucosidase
MEARSGSMSHVADYALIGDCRSAALISREGAIAWLCLPHFSSPSVFGSILDPERGGEFRITPIGRGRVRRRYLEGTNVLETVFDCENGTCRIVDSMPVPCGDPSFSPMREVLRSVECLQGQVALDITLNPRPDYGRKWPRLERRGAKLWAFTWGAHFLLLHADIGLEPRGGMLAGEHVLKAGERIWFSLSYSEDIGVIPGLGELAHDRLDRTKTWWRRWSDRLQYDGPYRAAVQRSALTLKLLCSAQSAAVVAAPTASLPEWPGADRNWDYRFCWLRDAALTMRAFTGLGCLDEGRAFLDWLLHATRLTQPRLQVVYDVYGRTDLPEYELNRWRGFRGSRPVRIGNAASRQLQLDVYGSVCTAAREYVAATGTLRRDEARLLHGFGEVVCKSWRQPDNGIWEIRGPRRQYTYSKIMCWTALDALRQLRASGHLGKLRSAVRTTAPAIEDCIESDGYDRRRKTYVGTLGGAEADASLLLAGTLGYRGPGDPHMRGTFEYVHRRLARNGLLYRYEPGMDRMSAPEGAFVICSFFAIDHLASRGELDAAHETMRHVLSYSNDVGLLSEEIDPETGELLGNFPQAYAHVGLVNAALRLHAQESSR